ncbi:MAG TPA: hypothetical protein VK208_09660 [Pyrinomonadaceae bacterium]|nr:hypothetical protein [Pyrinomonadaceae bacterium]
MKKIKKKRRPLGSEEDTMRAEYDFSKAVRGVTAARYAKVPTSFFSTQMLQKCFLILAQSTKRCALWRA